MSQSLCKRFWEGTIGVKIRPQKKRDGTHYWTFSFVRAFKRGDDSPWEYAQYYHQNDATRLGLVMSKAFQFMEETDANMFAKQATLESSSLGDTQSQTTTTSKAA